MLLNIGQVVAAIGALMDDPSNLEFDKDYCLPFINLAWMDIAMELSSYGLQYQEEIVEIAAFPAGTANLDTYQADGGVLESMVLPTLVEWKRVGEDDEQYREADLREKLPDVRAISEGIVAYQFRKGQVFLTPSAVDVDLRVTFKAYSLDFVDPASEIIIGAGNLIAYKTGEMMCSPAVRNNAAQMQYLASKYRTAADDFENVCVKQKNREGFRIGRIHGRNRRRRMTIVSG